MDYGQDVNGPQGLFYFIIKNETNLYEYIISQNFWAQVDFFSVDKNISLFCYMNQQKWFINVPKIVYGSELKKDSHY